ncbi:MAG: hypothetical protein ACRD2U_10430 [Terriglobales bacterium]
MKTDVPASTTDIVREYAVDSFVRPARHRHQNTFSINVGVVHKNLKLGNRVPLVCNALKSNKFLKQNHLRLVSSTGPESGLSTTVTYTYEFLGSPPSQGNHPSRQEAWNRLRGALKDVFAELGGGENYLRNERANFYGPGKDK